jgi:hypothetical protein
MALDANSRYMTLPVLKKIRDMVEAGAVVVGDKPVGTPSLSDNQDEFRKIVSELWSDEKGENIVGKGKIFTGQALQDVLDELNIKSDFSYTKLSDSTKLLYVHRILGSTDIYWVNNRSSRVENLEATFRVTGKEAEIWCPVTGKTEQASYTIGNGITRVPLHLEANGAVFVVFRNKTNQKSRVIAEPREQVMAVIEGPWEVSFRENRGAPARASFQDLKSWNENSDDGIKYFSGTGTYTRTIAAPADWFSEDSELWLDLGSVKNLAEVIINGTSKGIVWKTPFRINVTGALKEGDNKLEIKVTNLWVNRLIGDQQPGVEKKITYTTMDFYRADSPLKPSGLLGPVQILRLSN